MPKVSVIIPVYNVESYLSRCLDSIISQTFKDIEVVCVNDGSTDSSPKILECYSKMDNRVRVINKKNGGLSSARNAGVMVAKGEYILFVDSDDYISTNAVERLYKNAEKNISDMVVFAYVQGDKEYAPVKKMGTSEYRGFENKPCNAKKLPDSAYRAFPVSAWCKFYKTDFIRNKSFYEDMIYEDIPFWADVFTSAERITYIDEALYFYRTGRIGQIMQTKSDKVMDVIKAYKRVYKLLIEREVWQRYRHQVQMLMMLDSLLKYNVVLDEYKEKMFYELKSMSDDIDFEYFDKSCRYDFEKDAVRRFHLIECLSFEKYEKCVAGGV